MAWLSGWQYRKSHVINSASGAGTNYQIKIKTFKSSDFKNFSEVWLSEVLHDETTGRNLIVDGDYLYAVCEQGKKLVIYDISNPQSPVLKSSTTTSYNNIDLKKKGNYLFISNTDGVDVYNVSNHGIFISGDYLYGCMHQINKFVIIDISDPTNPVTKGSLTDSTNLYGCHDCYVDGNYAYVGNYLHEEADSNKYGFVVLDVSDKNNPSLEKAVTTSQNINHSLVLKIGNYCYVGTHEPTHGIVIYDISTPNNPQKIDHFFSDTLITGYWMVQYDENTLAVLAPKEPALYLLDITDKTSPVILCNVTTWGDNQTLCVANKEQYFYVSTFDNDKNWKIQSFELIEGDVNEMVGLNNHCRDDFGDVRFTKSDGITLLDYWMEEKVDGEYAVFWVEVADDLSSSDVTVYIYYGKSDNGVK